MKSQIMIDLETLGQKPGCVILALGAVEFGKGKTLREFYERIDPESCVSVGLKMDAKTVMWWMRRENAARLEVSQPGGKHLADVLRLFSGWVGNGETAEVWGNGAAFDNVILGEAFERTGIARPWRYWNDRCYRTVKALRPDVPCERIGTHHNALEDAKTQALHLMQIFATPSLVNA